MESNLLNELERRGCGVRDLLDDTYMGNEAFYVKMLGQLPGSDALDRIEAALATADVGACFEAAHALKGLYAMLGLTPAYDVCCAIVEKTRSRSSMDGVPELFAELRGVHSGLAALIAAG